MLPEEVFEAVKNMLPEDEALPGKFEALYVAVKRKADCLQNGKQLSPEMLALILVLTRDKAPVEIKAAEIDTPVITETGDLGDHLKSLRFQMGAKVKVLRDGEMLPGVIAGIPFGGETRYRVKMDGETKPKTIEEKYIILTE